MKELNEAKVLAVGPGGFDKDGKRIGVSVQPGDKVLIPQVRQARREMKLSAREASGHLQQDLMDLHSLHRSWVFNAKI